MVFLELIRTPHSYIKWRRKVQTRQWDNADEIQASFHLNLLSKQAWKSPSLFPLFSFLTIFPVKEPSDPILSCKHFLVCFSSTYLLNKCLTHVMVYAPLDTLTSPLALSFLKAEMSQTDPLLCLLEGHCTRWWGPPCICRMHYQF